ncbi:hypothetical protein [Brucella intermedia]|uniref:hypothetical protein n=1 Tax=Brucella intermedia TaxID=94625 RepID=UPI0034CEDAFB
MHTEYLTHKGAENILHAIDYAKFIGFNLNTFVTITFDKCFEFNEDQIFIKIRESYRRWLANACSRNNLPKCVPYWLFVFESPHRFTHVHWLVHVPVELAEEFKRKVPKWVKKRKDNVFEHSIDIRPVNIYEDKVLGNYLVKGVTPDSIEYFNLENYAEYQGWFRGRRSMVCHALSLKSRRKARFKATRDRNLWLELHPELAARYDRPSWYNSDMTVPQISGLKTFEYQKHFRNKRRRNPIRRRYGYRVYRRGPTP